MSRDVQIDTLSVALRAMLERYGPPDAVAHMCNYPADHPVTKARAVLAQLDGIAAPRHTKRVRRFPNNELGITIGAIEYIMPIAEANELVGMIYAARHSQPLNWSGAALEETGNAG